MVIENSIVYKKTYNFRCNNMKNVSLKDRSIITASN
jgi:hypothetical protein